MDHQLPLSLTQSAIRILVVGCGGTGSQLLPRLVQLHRTLLALNHPSGLNVTVYDADCVALHNCIRQNFVEADVGLNKAEITVYRLNVAHGLKWKAEPSRFHARSLGWGQAPHFIIGCVDSKQSRREIEAYVRANPETYWCDLGNESVSGQMVVGRIGRSPEDRLPLVTELFPEIVEGDEDDQPSCSAVESILRQGVATNLMAAAWAFSWLTEAIRHGHIGWHGVFFNLSSGRVSPIQVDEAGWEAMGFSLRPKTPAKRKKKAKAA